MPADELYDEFEIDWMPVWPDEDGRLEPIFFDGPQWIEFAEVEPLILAPEPATAAAALLAQFDAFALFEPAAGGEEPEEPLPPARQPASAASLAASFGAHLLALLVLVAWHAAPAQIAGAIPVQLVIEAPAAPADENVAGQSVAVTADQAPQTDSRNVTPAEPPPARPQVANLAPPAKPRPPPPPRPRPPTPPPRPVPPTHSVTQAATPAPAPPPKAAEGPPVRVASAPLPPRPAAVAAAPSAASIAVRHEGAVVGIGAAAATGDGDYFARLEELTRPYLYMLSPNFLAGRRGSTTLSIAVADDGAIGRIGVKRSSGYPDIDARIEQMIAAIGRFPPLPPQLRRPGVDLDFNLVFPDVLQQ